VLHILLNSLCQSHTGLVQALTDSHQQKCKGSDLQNSNITSHYLYINKLWEIWCARKDVLILNSPFLYNDISNQQDATKFLLLILLSLLYMFWVTVLPIFSSTLTVYTAFWNNVPTLLSAADWWHRLDLDSIQSVSPVGSRRQSQYIAPKSCIYSQSAPEDEQNCRPKHVEQA